MIYEISRLYALNSMVDKQPKKERKKERKTIKGDRGGTGQGPSNG